MVRAVAIAFILAHIFLLMFMVQASDRELSALVVERRMAEQPSSSVDEPHLTMEGEDDEGDLEAEAPASRRLGKHKGTDSSVAGGGVILGGLAMAVFAAVFCYIRVTRKRTNVNV
ncbi:hypothetical protein QQ045_010934 [Rhodiola kirilowii]